MNNNLNTYFDNAATSWPKPEPVYRAAEEQMRHAAGNPGRSGHTRTLEADRLVYRAREAVSHLFNVSDPARLVFCYNATDALNIALKGFLEKGDHVLFTAMEHNSVLRPLGRLVRDGLVTTTMIPCSSTGDPDLDFLQSAYRPETRLLVINHASNVTGTIAPLGTMIKSAREKGVKVLVDAAQTAGVLPIDVVSEQVDMLAFTGHKGLLGPTGTGGLYVAPGIDLKPLREGGTGSQSELDSHPESMPERLEAGTMNSAGLAGLLEGVNYITRTGLEEIQARESSLRSSLDENLRQIKGLTVHGPGSDRETVSVLSFTMEGIDCGEAGYILESSYGILCRTGLHCAPHAHRSIGTFPQGTVRISPGYFNSKDDLDYLVKALKEISAMIN